MGASDIIYTPDEERAYNKGRQDAAMSIFDKFDKYIMYMIAFSRKQQSSYDDLNISKYTEYFCNGEISALWDMSNFISELKKTYKGE